MCSKEFLALRACMQTVVISYAIVSQAADLFARVFILNTSIRCCLGPVNQGLYLETPRWSVLVDL
uniref:Uncharacterized protein n=1 Tax=Arundo donax TaxID=35708 RepID=A0A0A9FET1_ARUDO